MTTRPLIKMQYPATAEKARISEIFSSLQGEGTHVGERHIFIRFEECNIHCTYCDELGKPAEWMRIEEVEGSSHAFFRSQGRADNSSDTLPKETIQN